jgi:glycosyltransferase involved in cell wall biosynthesis
VPIVDLFDFPFLKRFAFLKSYVTFSISALFYLLFSARRSDIIYSNEPLPLFFASFFFKSCFYEAHDFPKRTFLNRTLFSRVKGIIATNKWKAEELARAFGLANEKILYEPNAVDVEAFARASGIALRKKLNVSNSIVLLGYVGALRTMEMEKGIDMALEALAALPPRFHMLVVGGSPEDKDFYKRMANSLGIHDRVVFTGWVKHSTVPEYMAACDVLIAPFPRNEHYDLFMSPMKVFEYMATGKPIAASRLRTIEEILDDSNAFLFEPGNKADLISKVTEASATEGRARAARARERVQEHSWEKRASRIAAFISPKL